MFDKLFSPITIKDMTLRNHVVLPAMGTRFTSDRFVNEKHIAYHAARARGGSGLNMVEVTSVHEPSAPKMFLSIAEDKYIPKLKELTDAIHAEGGKAGVQLWQGSLATGMDQNAMMLMVSDTELAPGFVVPGIWCTSARWPRPATGSTPFRWAAWAIPSIPPFTITTPSARCSASTPSLKVA